MKDEILKRLGEIEREENVRIFFACESGSRAWGFPSADSDYDVRFLYLHPRDWYLSIDVEEKRDVIERPISDALDISGWDLRKALKLLRKSNPPLLEWLNSPIVYKEEPAQEEQAKSITDKLRGAVAEFYSPRSSYYHYLHMAEGNFREYLKGDTVWIKKYFYVLRPLLAIRWIEADPHPVPMEFETLVDRCVDSHELKQAIDDLLARKRAGQELDRQPRIETISRFIESDLERLKAKPDISERPRQDFEKLNTLFRYALDETDIVKRIEDGR
jgi:predicted nucleotidyltransferase